MAKAMLLLAYTGDGSFMAFSFRYAFPPFVSQWLMSSPIRCPGRRSRARSRPPRMSVARLDERLGSSLIREGWISRTHVLDACASLWLQGALVHLEDLVLHDAAMDLRAPTHDLTRAHAVLRTRRRIAAAEPGWATSPAGLAALSQGRTERGGGASGAGIAVIHEPTEEKAGEGACDDDAFAAELAAIDAVLERSSRVLAGAVPPRAQDPLALVYDLDWDEGARLQEWRRVVEGTRTLPPLLAAALAYDAWIPSSRCSTGLGSGRWWFRGFCERGAKREITCPASMERCASCRMTAGARGISRHDWWRSWKPSRSGQGRGSRTTIAGGFSRASNASCPGAESTRSCQRWSTCAGAAVGLGRDDRGRARGDGPGRPGPRRRAGLARNNGAGALPRLGHPLSQPHFLPPCNHGPDQAAPPASTACLFGGRAAIREADASAAVAVKKVSDWPVTRLRTVQWSRSLANRIRFEGDETLWRGRQRINPDPLETRQPGPSRSNSRAV